MDWTIVVSVLVALLLVPLVLAVFGGLVIAIAATVFRHRLPALREHAERCKEMCAGAFGGAAGVEAAGQAAGCPCAEEGR